MINKKLIWIIGGILLLAIAVQYKERKASLQTVVPDLTKGGCFERSDCFISIKEGYCNVKFDCVAGKCASEDILCPETCNSGKDDDLDGYADCGDTDCWNSPSCSCTIMDFNECATGRCYCEPGTNPRWHITESEGNFCACT